MVDLKNIDGNQIVSNKGYWYKISLADGSELGLGDIYQGNYPSGKPPPNGRTLVKVVPAGQGMVFAYQRFDGDNRSNQGWPIGDKGYLRGLQVTPEGGEIVKNISLSWEPAKLCLYDDNTNYGIVAEQLPGNRAALYAYDQDGTVCGLRVVPGGNVIAHKSTHALALDCQIVKVGTNRSTGAW
ncbi:hypothetical protein CMQ_7689 [Grosmannia clavigera kw1407]|uniref:Uncharacterized protein n=1 Tax=Grosmannia clavigera (strain kw1407 / UAMH 11150) TaxID=655863 RepID=F0XQD6_GROCL|nr:uncharacterized protein CMQ_7689 [Grosmannia clavigera kw1407]EFX00687.1 hypothetical protein CMQ_7689 [Grosmannia clavigera kw1407]